MRLNARTNVDALLEMASAVARKYVDAPSAKPSAGTELVQAVVATWALVKGRLRDEETEALDQLMEKISVGSGKRAEKTALGTEGRDA